MRPHGIASVPLDVLNLAHAPSPVRVHVVPSTPSARRGVPPVPDHAVAAHAQHAATAPVSVLGEHVTVLARVLMSSSDLELRLVSADADPAPMLFRFPAPVLAHVGLWEDAASSDIQVLAVTTAAHVYRLRVPLACLLRGVPLPPAWSDEHAVQHLAGEAPPAATSVYMADAGALLLACADGLIVHLKLLYDGAQNAWKESALRPSSFSLTRLFQRGDTHAPTQTLAIACHLRDSETPLAFCVCRDRSLRVWNLATDTLVRTLALPVAPGDDALWNSASVPLVQLYYPDDSSFSFCALVYVPTSQSCLAAYGVELEESSSWSGGLGEMALLWSRPCDPHTQSSDMELRDMAVVPHDGAWRVWLLWHAAGAPLVQTTRVDGAGAAAPAPSSSAPLVLGAGEEPWMNAAPWTPYTPLHGPALEAALASGSESLASLFLTRLFEPGRFSTTTLAAALRLEGVHVDDSATPADLAAAMAAHIGPGDAAEPWLRLTRRIEHVDRTSRWPLHLAVHGGVPWIVTRHALGVVRPTGPGAWLATLAARMAEAAPWADRPSARLAGEAASAEYAHVVNDVARSPSELYAPILAGQAPLLQLATLAAEALGSLGPRAARLADAAVATALRAPSGALSAVQQLPVSSAVLERLPALADRLGGDGLVQQWARYVEVLVQDDVAVEWLPAATATVLLASMHARLHGLRAALVLMARVTEVPALAPVQAAALAGWQRLRPLYQLLSKHSATSRLLLAQTALQDGVAADAPLAMWAAYLAPLAPHAVRDSLQSSDDVPCVYWRARAAALTQRTDEAYRDFVVVGAALLSGAAWSGVPWLGADDAASRQFQFWRHAAQCLEYEPAAASRCYRQAMRALESGAVVDEKEAREVWTLTFTTQLQLQHYDEAAATILALPLDDVRTACITTLVTTLCRAHDLATLLRLDLLEWQPQVERTLSFQARHASPLAAPAYFPILYAYHVSRGDYKSAAASMYQHARRLQVLAYAAPSADTDGARASAVRQAQSYLAAINALSLLAPSHAWFAHAPDPAEAPARVARRGHALTGHVTSYVPDKAPGLRIVQLADLRAEYTELLTRLALVRHYPELAQPHTPLRAEDAVYLLLANDDVDAAFSTALQLALPMDSLFDALADKCVALQRAQAARAARAVDPDVDAGVAALRCDDEESADPAAQFLRRSQRAAHWPGPAHERAWRYTQLHLDMAPSADVARYYRVLAERLVALHAWEYAPPWLATYFRTRAPDVLVRVWMKAGELGAALAYLDELWNAPTQPTPGLPYTLLDSVLAAADAEPAHQPQAAALRARVAAAPAS